MSTLTSATPPTHVATHLARTRIARITGTSVWLAFAALACFWSFIAPKFDEIFSEFGVSLPLTSRVIIQVGRFCASGIGVASLLALLFLVLAPVAWACSKTLRAAATLAIFAGVCWMITLMVIIVGMSVPLTKMIESLQG